jgi:hypothetical protein
MRTRSQSNKCEKCGHRFPHLKEFHKLLNFVESSESSESEQEEESEKEESRDSVKCFNCLFESQNSIVVQTRDRVNLSLTGKVIQLSTDDDALTQYLSEFVPSSNTWFPVLKYETLLVDHDCSRLVIHKAQDGSYVLAWWTCLCGEMEYTMTCIPKTWGVKFKCVSFVNAEDFL